MPTMTKQDVEKLIKDVAGEVLGEQINVSILTQQ